MNKSDLIEAMADSADISKAAAGRALDGLIDAITGAVRENDTGRNPKTGGTIQIAASKTPAFKAGKAFKDAVN